MANLQEGLPKLTARKDLLLDLFYTLEAESKINFLPDLKITGATIEGPLGGIPHEVGLGDGKTPESLSPKVLSGAAKHDFKKLQILESLALSGNYMAAEGLYDLAKCQEGGNDVYAMRSLIKVGRAGYTFAWEMLSTLAEESNELVIELQMVVQEKRSVGALGALEGAAKKNPRAAAAVEYLRRTKRRFTKDGEVGPF
jgi:hypothetical protein